MDRDAIASAAITILCVVAIGVTAGALEESVATDPDDVINLDWRQLPLSEEQVKDAKDEIQANADADATQRADRSKPSEHGSTGPTKQQEPSIDPSTSIPPDLVDRIFAILTALLPFLVSLIALIGLAALLRRYWDRLRGFFTPPATPATTAPTQPSVLPGTADNAIDHAWLTMVRRLDLDHAHTHTPRELATAAHAAGMDPSAVDTITQLFLEHHYSPRATTEADAEHATAAHHALSQGRPA